LYFLNFHNADITKLLKSFICALRITLIDTYQLCYRNFFLTRHDSIEIQIILLIKSPKTKKKRMRIFYFRMRRDLWVISSRISINQFMIKAYMYIHKRVLFFVCAFLVTHSTSSVSPPHYLPHFFLSTNHKTLIKHIRV
jgi:hypothetical protein